MKSDVAIPEVLPISPITLACPFCKAKPGKDCATSSGGLAILHLARIKAAAAIDVKNAKARKEKLRVSALT